MTKNKDNDNSIIDDTVILRESNNVANNLENTLSKILTEIKKTMK